MVPGSPDLAAWLARELSFVLLEEDPEGRLRVVAGALGTLEAPHDDEPLASAVCRAIQLPTLPPDVAAGIDAAREGTPGTALVPDPGPPAMVLCWPCTPGRARVLIAPHAEAMARRAAAAELAAGVTHEVANALTAIAGWTRMAATGGPLPDRTRQALDVVQRSARDALGTARGLLSTMRDSARPSLEPSREDPTDVGAVVREVVETLRPELEEARIELITEIEDGVLASTPPSALRLIVSNLVRNAFEALGEGGAITVGVAHRGERLGLTVADDGPGMDRETLDLAFDRYFTTKREGTGLGLALVRDTVHEAGGQVEVHTRRGGGTRFEILLPRAGDARLSLRPPAIVTSSSGVHPRPPLSERRVLVVDDDHAMRGMVQTALELQGARVSTAGSLEEALAIEGRFDLALVDLALGDGRGDALLHARREDIGRAVLLTGSSDALAVSDLVDAVLRKPFELDELHRLLEHLLRADALEADG